MKVNVKISQQVALKRGVAQWGDVPVELQPILDRLTEQERTQIRVESDMLRVATDNDPFTVNYNPICVTEPTPEEVVQSIRVVLAQNAAKRLERLTEWRKILLDPERYLDPDGRRRYHYDAADIAYTCKKLGEDPQLYQDALDAAAETVAAKNKADWRQYLDQWFPGASFAGDLPYHRHRSSWYGGSLSIDAAKSIATEFGFEDVLDRIQKHQEILSAREEEQKQRKEWSRQAWIQWAIDNGSEDLREAIADQYPLGQEVEREVERAVFPAPGSDSIFIRKDVRDFEERKVPRQDARRLASYLEDQVEAAKERLPAGSDLIVGRICSVELYIDCDCEGGCPQCDEDHEVKVRRTAIPVHLVSAHHKATRWYVIAE